MIFKNNRLYIFQNKLIDYDRYINIQKIKKQLYKQQNALNRHQYQLNNQYKRQKIQQEELKQQQEKDKQVENQLTSEITRVESFRNELKTYVDTSILTAINNQSNQQQIIDNLNVEIARAQASEAVLLSKIDALYKFFLNTTSEVSPTR